MKKEASNGIIGLQGSVATRAPFLVRMLLFIMTCCLFVWGGEVEFSTACTKQNLPVTVGGSRDDVANCIVHDPINELIIVGGTTQSNDFGPSNVDNGFLYAMNYAGDWTWGNYFRNQTSEIRQITGCQLSTDGRQMVVLGATREQVIMAVVNTTDGRMNNLYSLESKEGAKRDAEPPQYETFGAILLDSRDYQDGKAYIYTSFLMDGQQQLVRILQAVPDRTNEFPVIKYHFWMSDFPPEEVEDGFVRQKTPQYMFVLPQRDYEESYFMTGTYRGVGSVMKFYKRNGVLRWHAQLDTMTRVDAIAYWKTSRQGRFFGCGSNNYDDRAVSPGVRPSNSDAWFFSMDADGQLNWLLNLAGQSLADDTLLSDSCQGMVFDEKTDKIVTVVQTDSPQFRVKRDGRQKDTMLLEIDLNGSLERVVSFTLGSDLYEMLSFAQNLVKANNYYYMAGQLYGFQTRTQADIFEPNLDSFLFPLAFREDRPTAGCIVDQEMRGDDLQRFSTLYNKRQSEPKFQLKKNDDRAVPKIKQSDTVYGLYYSKFVQTRSLESFVNVPRPCAFQSINLMDTPIEYLRGSQPITFSIADESVYAPLITQMAPSKGGVTRVIDQTGQETRLAKFSPENGGEVMFETNVPRQLGLNELIIQHCDIYERLFDLRLQIEVKRNSQPFFVTSPQLTFRVAVGETLYYELPDIVDPQGNAEAEVLFLPFMDYAELYPPFMEVFSGNRSFELKPDSEEYAEKAAYFFRVILREQGSSYIGNQYTFQVFLDNNSTPDDSSGGGNNNNGNNGDQDNNGGNSSSNGEIFDEEGENGGGNVAPTEGNALPVATGTSFIGQVIATDTYDQMQAKYFQFMEVYTTDIVGRTQIKFTSEVDMAQVEKDIETIMFTEYVQMADYFYDERNITLKNISYSSFNANNQTVNVSLQFEDPFDLGLILDQSDHIYFFMNETYDWKTLLVKQPSSDGLYDGLKLQNQARARIELTFDFDNETMETIVVFSSVFYGIMILFLVVQLVLLLWKNVGLLTFWVLIDYSQLIAFLPLMTARFVPYVVEAYRPFLITHQLYKLPGDEQAYYDQSNEDFYNLSFQAYDLSREIFLKQSALIWTIKLAIIIVLDITFCILKRSCCKESERVAETQLQFRWNIYIRNLMMAYMDMVLIAGLVFFDPSEEKLSFRGMVALLVIILMFFIPLCILFYLCSKFDQLKEKESKRNFNTLLLKINKEDRWRIFLPCFFFIRRFMTAFMIVLGATDMAPAYAQFSVVIMLSAILMFYLAKEEPYITRRMNIYVLSMEFTYFMLGMMAFAFTDATDDLNTKRAAAIASIVFLCLFVCANFLMSFYFACQGRTALREQDLYWKEKRRRQVSKRESEKDRRKNKRQRKKQKEKDAVELQRKNQLTEKRDELKRQGYTSEEIDAKLAEEPIQKSGFQFGAVMGKRLVDYGIMSSSSDSQEEVEEEVKIVSQKSQRASQQRKMDEQRRESRPVPMLDDDAAEQDQVQRRQLPEDSQTNNPPETEEDMTARQLQSADRTADLTARSATRLEQSEDDDVWMHRSTTQQQRHLAAKSASQKKEEQEGEGEYDAEYEEYGEYGEEEEYGEEWEGDGDAQHQKRAVSMDFEDEQVYRDPEFDASRMNTDRPLFTEANDDDEDDNLNMMLQINNNDSGRQGQQLQRQPSQYEDDGNRVNSHVMSFNQDPQYVTRQDITAQSSSQHGMLTNSDENVMRLAAQY